MDYLKGGLGVGLGQMPKCMLAKYSHLRFQKQYGRSHYGKKETTRMILAIVSVLLSASGWENPWALSGLWTRRLLPAWLSWWKAWGMDEPAPCLCPPSVPSQKSDNEQVQVPRRGGWRELVPGPEGFTL